VSVDGRPVDPVFGPTAALVGAAEKPVELTVRDASGSLREVVVQPLADERPLRYQRWVAGRREHVHSATDGRVGYVHIPDMIATGWAELHRDLRVEVAREGLVIDVRDNRGGHTSSLVLETLGRTVRAWDMGRHIGPTTYPPNAPRGPRVLVTNEQAGSDGDIVTVVFRQLGLGPIVGTRTWGGVIGYDGRYTLVDGTSVTQPRYAFWFTDVGWGVENYGVDPDIEVPQTPQDWGAGRDPQLDRAIALVLEALVRTPAAEPPDVATRPSRTPPPLAPRP
jgi:tricorn protease